MKSFVDDKKEQVDISNPTLKTQKKKKYFIIGIIVFGILSMIIVNIIKTKEEES